MATAMGTARDRMADAERILVRRVDNLGDIVIALPVLRELRRHLPSGHFTLSVRPEHRVLLNNYADAFIEPVSRGQLAKLSHRFDLTVNIELSLPRNYRPAPLGSRRLIHIGVSDWAKRQHIYRHLLDGLAQHGVACNYQGPKTYLTAITKAQAREWIRGANLDLDTDFIVAVNAGSGFLPKRWPVTRYLRLCKWLIAELDARILVLSESRRDRPAGVLVRQLPSRYVRWLAGKPADLVAAILSLVDLCVGNDSGIAHLASAVGLPTVTIFGPTAPRFWKPIGRNAVTVFNQSVRCTCGYENSPRCRDRICLTSLTETDMADAILLCLNKYVGRGKKPSLDRIRVAREVEARHVIGGVRLQNRHRPRPLLVRFGIKQVARVLGVADRLRSFAALITADPDHRELVEMLLLHRILVSDSERIRNRRL